MCGQAGIIQRPSQNIWNPQCTWLSRVSSDSWDIIDASIRTFAKIADPLHEYVKGDTAKKKEWVVPSEVARNAFHKLKKAVMSTPVLACPDPNKEYLLKTNALRLGLGAVLSQKQSNGRYHPVAFGNRALHGTEVN